MIKRKKMQNISASVNAETFAFHPVPTWFSVLIIIVSCVIGVSGVTGNLLIIAVFVRFRKMRTVTNTFILSLAVKDFMTLSCFLPPYLVVLAKDEYPYSYQMCMALSVMRTTVIAGSGIDLTNIAINRYIIICRPKLRATIYNHRMHVAGLLVLPWILGLLNSVPLMMADLISFHPVYRLCTIVSMHTVRNVLLCLLIFVPLISTSVFCYSNILKKVIESKKSLARYDSASHSGSQRQHSEINTMVLVDKTQCRTGCVSVPADKELPDSNGQRKEVADGIDKVDDETKERSCKLKARCSLRSPLRGCTVTQRHINKLRCEFFLFILYVFLTGPYCVTRVLEVLSPASTMWQLMTLILVFANSFFNSLVYGFMNTQFQRAFKELLPVCFRWREKRVGVAVSEQNGSHDSV